MENRLRTQRLPGLFRMTPRDLRATQGDVGEDQKKTSIPERQPQAAQAVMNGGPCRHLMVFCSFFMCTAAVTLLDSAVSDSAGILGAVVVSLVLIVYQVADPPITTLGSLELWRGGSL